MPSQEVRNIVEDIVARIERMTPDEAAVEAMDLSGGMPSLLIPVCDRLHQSNATTGVLEAFFENIGEPI